MVLYLEGCAERVPQFFNYGMQEAGIVLFAIDHEIPIVQAVCLAAEFARGLRDQRCGFDQHLLQDDSAKDFRYMVFFIETDKKACRAVVRACCGYLIFQHDGEALHVREVRQLIDVGQLAFAPL